MEITADFIKKAISTKHLNYTECVELAETLKVHEEGRVPEDLIYNRRPSEPEEIKAYRKTIYVPKTKNPINKVINSLEKIRRSQDWVIDYDRNNIAPSIRAGEDLQTYCETKYPVHTSITNWMFAEGMRQYLLDANGVFAVIPFDIPQTSGDYVKPVAMYFDSKQVINYVDGEYAVLKSYDTATYTTPAGVKRYTNGEVYFIITATDFYRYEQIDTQKTLDLTQVYKHNIGRLPVFKAGGVFYKRKNNDTIYRSRIDSMVPSLNEAAREYSDLQAEIVQHIHSEKYAYTNTECKSCKGTGIIMKDGTQASCTNCNGSGSVLNTSPYGMHLISVSNKIDEYQLPTPPIGYVTKTTDIAKLQDERIRQHIYDSLATLNMEFLAETPLNQSGTAKEVDKDELNNFVNSIAEDIVRIMDNVYSLINDYRYNIIVSDVEKRKLMLPSINVPTKYDILSSTYLLSELKIAKDSGVSPTVLRALEVEYAKKKFCTDMEIGNEAELCSELDPLYGISEDEKMTRKSNGGVSDIDYIISCNITQFVRRAISEKADFYTVSDADKNKTMLKYAEEKQKQITVTPIDMNAGL